MSTKANKREMLGDLRSGLGKLPAPKNEYQIMLPDVETGEEEAAGGEPMEEDMADVMKRKAEMEREAYELELRKRSKALQRALPRPLSMQGLPRGSENLATFDPKDQGQHLILQEMHILLDRDAAKYPLKKEKKPRAVPQIPDYTETAIAEAGLLIEEELLNVKQGMGHSDTTNQEYANVWDACYSDIMWLPSANAYGRAARATNSDRLASLQGDFERVRSEMDKDSKKAAKLETKLNVLTAGYQKKALEHMNEIATTMEQLKNSRVELACFKALQQQENLTAPLRLEKLQNEVAEQVEREKALQAKYESLSSDLRVLSNEAVTTA